ncbi:MAG: 3-hydroxyacyl-CoA dehydrogenase NAD-binding domain-containing protein [Verrucomicrobiae bacterium]|nr:3-hydroxyacyl-CoA dehydrogenase NAD-binding domain-containing protein [Verrucomicrobiae bacterium]
MTTPGYSISNGLCILRLNAPPVNAITLTMLEELRAAIGQAQDDPRVGGIIITGSAEHFSAGADVELFRNIKCADDAVRVSRLFQEAFQEIEDSAKPVAAAVAGKVMGGALELAMACHYRVCERGALFSMPEVNLGINPGAGGTQRLPRLIGVEAALTMLLTAKPLDAAKALALGLVDAVSDGDELIACAADLLRPGPGETCAAPRKTRDRKEKILDPAAKEAAFEKAREQLKKARPEIVAPALIVEAVRTGLTESFEAGLRKEQEAFARCMETLATRNKIYVFLATRETGKAPELAKTPARPVNRVGVIGMGSMGAGIAQAVIQAGLPVIVTDENTAALQKGQERIRDSLQKRVAQGRLPAERLEAALKLLTVTTDSDDLAKADLVIEAVFEELAVKSTVLGAVEGVISDDAILATNTSTLSLDALAESLRRPQRLIGLHFFNPAHHMPLLEVIRRPATSPEVVATAMRFAKTLRKTPVLVRNREGFIVNRIFLPYVKEAFWLLEDGADAAAIDRAMVAFGYPMGPLTLIDMAGIDILVHTDAVLSAAFPHHGCLSPIATALVQRGMVGQKKGAGVYRYEKGDHAPHPNPAAQEIIAQTQQESGRPPRPVSAEEITQRLILRMVAEAFRVLEEGIALRESDVDVAMVLGTGFPDFRGGVLKYAHDLGLREVLTQLESLTDQLGERFAPCRKLRQMSAV